MSTKSEEETDDIVVDRSCIGCDKCGVVSPQKCCGRCGSFYYCSKECQVQHWKTHKGECTYIKEHFDDWKAANMTTLPDGTPFDTKEGPCAICLEESIANPVILPCGHVFCFTCVGSYQLHNSNEEASCPYCRGEIPNVTYSALERAKLYNERAFAATIKSEEQKKYANLALAEYDAYWEIEECPGEEHNLLRLYNVATLTALKDQPADTIKIMKEVLSLNEKLPDVLVFEKVIQLKHWLADAYNSISKWEDARDVYQGLIEEYFSKYEELPSGTILTGCSRTFYETHEYHASIEYGNRAIEMGRYKPGVHKYVALSQKARGNINEAKKTMTRAILYERHWDKDNRKENEEVLQMILAEEAKDNKPKSKKKGKKKIRGKK